MRWAVRVGFSVKLWNMFAIGVKEFANSTVQIFFICTQNQEKIIRQGTIDDLIVR